MLRKLSLKLTFINVLISGVILIALALVVLRVAENVMTAQYESDLKAYSSQMVTLAVKTIADEGEPRLHFQMPGKYAVYISDEDLNLSIDTMLTDDDVKDILPDLRVKVSSELPSGVKKVLPVEATAFYYTEKDAVVQQEHLRNGLMPFFTTVTTVTSKNPYLYTMNDQPYRISASMISDEDSERTMLILQNRTDELASRGRLRWVFGFSIAGGLALIVLASLFLSSRAIRPIEASLRQQCEFVAAASHELRTPVAAISANAEVLKDAELSEFAPFLTSIETESGRMARLISDLLILARADAGELPIAKTLIDAGEIAGDVMQLMAPLADQNGLTLKGDIKTAHMMGDADRLRQVLMALMDNALRYTEGGGTVTVAANKVARYVVVSVSDTGPGIPDEHKARVFDRFYRVDTARGRMEGGAGLGLSVAKQFVEQMGGTIFALNRKGGGCVFEMRFNSIGGDL